MSEHEWQAPGPDDKRSACPALNTLANHGYLPRDGNNITSQQLIKALQDAYNLSGILATVSTYNGVVTNGLLLKKTFNLEELSKHNTLEHDASLTRKDKYFGNPLKVDNELVDKLLDHQVDGKINLDSLAKQRQMQLNHSKEHNPKLTYGFVQKILSGAEGAMLVNVMGGNTNFEVDVAMLETFLKHERLPHTWRKPEKPVSPLEVFNNSNALMKKYDELEKEQHK
ncbi:16285_t:CDS:2 [Cetraspora pellucida]|uniref:16285_t:CDS:1 n=1 Tax=Cetraspora pellucida TaxID=1433469 RepID=A0ACA9P0S0_9GLOM|nr:16285_t:CDS:2 [Cetraspora pellucida]